MTKEDQGPAEHGEIKGDQIREVIKTENRDMDRNIFCSQATSTPWAMKVSESVSEIPSGTAAAP